MRAIKTTTIAILAVGLLAGSAIGVTAQDDAGPVSFSWTLSEGEGEFIEGTFEEGAGWMTMRDFASIDPMEADDYRASGLLTTAFNIDSWGDPEADVPERSTLTATSQRLVNDGGSWSGTGTEVTRSSGPDLDTSGTWMATMTGEDGYEGLTLILLRETNAEVGTGFIFPSVPPVPDLPAE